MFKLHRVDLENYSNIEDWTGLDSTGMEWTGRDWTGMDWTGLNWNGLDRAILKTSRFCTI